MELIEFLKAIIIGIIEGITEWLPVSSTGHMILVNELMRLNVSPEFEELFLVVIQLGAIAAVPVLFFDKLNPFSGKKSREQKRATWTLWFKVVVGVLPAAVLGLLFDDLIDSYLMHYAVVAATLIIYGVAFILIEKHKKGKEARIKTVDELTYKDALTIGAFQVLSLVPGTSRSGSTILGGMLTGVSREASAEFSFFMAIPVMLGASGLKAVKFFLEGNTASGGELLLLAVGLVVSFLVSLFAIKFLMDFVKRHSFAPFGIYRIILGALVLVYFVTTALV
ncbi:MAG: undecaprenyl-diphosphate phosphatase [Clostridia bacterium]|nr:undecaprenyl-diphosphate phosphatase [Clostridia bacterium]